ncbi:hypothetical protein SDC9_174778 [bioreactor metagenome]|uniref:Uncharacterized protein n=1 Tax=bioreactor metagenome TaxID=1076179 RepID=A0A645GKC7_9ZZZZ
MEELPFPLYASSMTLQTIALYCDGASDIIAMERSSLQKVEVRSTWQKDAGRLLMSGLRLFRTAF